MWIDNKELSETEVKSKIHKLEKENSDLKEILKQAINDIQPLMENYTWLSECKMCAKDIKSCNGCCEPTWRYAEQALKLIGGGANGSDE